MINNLFFYLRFLSLDIHESQERRDKGRPILNALYHFHSFHEEFDFNLAITADSSTLYIDSDRNRIYRQPLTSKVMAECSYPFYYTISVFM